MCSEERNSEEISCIAGERRRLRWMKTFVFRMLIFLQFLILGTLASGQEPDGDGFGDYIKLGEFFY